MTSNSNDDNKTLCLGCLTHQAIGETCAICSALDEPYWKKYSWRPGVVDREKEKLATKLTQEQQIRIAALDYAIKVAELRLKSSIATKTDIETNILMLAEEFENYINTGEVPE